MHWNLHFKQRELTLAKRYRLLQFASNRVACEKVGNGRQLNSFLTCRSSLPIFSVLNFQFIFGVTVGCVLCKYKINTYFCENTRIWYRVIPYVAISKWQKNKPDILQPLIWKKKLMKILVKKKTIYCLNRYSVALKMYSLGSVFMLLCEQLW